MIEPKVHGDARGSFQESWHAERYENEVCPLRFVQDNLSRSTRGVVRGLHYQHPRAQAKLISVVRGEIFDVMVDIRVGSPTFGQWEGFRLKAEESRQLFIPVGFAHGFAVLSEDAIFTYKCTDYYAPADEGIVRWNDPDLAIEWPVEDAVLSAKDADAPLLRDIPRARLPRYQSHRVPTHPFVVAAL